MLSEELKSGVDLDQPVSCFIASPAAGILTCHSMPGDIVPLGL
jgi:hypothetical protein